MAGIFAGVIGDTSGRMISDAILRRTGDPEAARVKAAGWHCQLSGPRAPFSGPLGLSGAA